MEKKKGKKNYSWLHPGSLPGLRKKKKKKKKSQFYVEVLKPPPYLSDKTNRIKIGREMKEKKQFMWFETNFLSPN